LRGTLTSSKQLIESPINHDSRDQFHTDDQMETPKRTDSPLVTERVHSTDKRNYILDPRLEEKRRKTNLEKFEKTTRPRNNNKTNRTLPTHKKIFIIKFE